MRSGGKVVTCMFRQFSRKFWRSGTDCGRGHVVHDVGKIRAVGAALVAAGMVLSGCASGDGEGASTTTSPATTEPSSDPWDLPIEQRPALFDPCAEMPVEALEQGLGAPVTKLDIYTVHEPGELMVCGWGTEQLEVSVLSTWKSRDEYLADRSVSVTDKEIGGRPGMRLLDNAEKTGRSCLQLFFTERGTMWLSVTPIGLFREFKGERFPDSCEVLEQVIPPIMAQFPKGDF